MIRDKKFLEEIKQAVRSIAGEDYRIELVDMEKNNNMVYTGMVIGNRTETISPTIQLETFYEAYLHGVPIQKIAEDIFDWVQQDHNTRPDIPTDFYHFEKFREKIIFRLVNTEKNRELLKKMPSVPVYENLSLIFVIILQNDEDGVKTVRISNQLMKTWNVEADELYRIALENTPRLLPASFDNIAQVFAGMQLCSAKDHGAVMDGTGEETPEELPMYVLSNHERINGAAAIAYPGVLEDIADRLDTNLIILPSSIHEVIIMPETMESDFHVLNAMVREINQTELKEEEILSDTAYYYDRVKRIVTVPVSEVA